MERVIIVAMEWITIRLRVAPSHFELYREKRDETKFQSTYDEEKMIVYRK